MDTLFQSEDYIKHKILFFFMPKTIVFTKKIHTDTDNVALLKAVSPCFYWCSAHEFITEYTDQKYLIQHQIYFINGENIEAANINQNWSKSKNEIRNGLFSFFDMWDGDHEKIILNPDNTLIESSQSLNLSGKIYNFSDFASFVAKSIFGLKNEYINQAKFMNFDSIQKEFWKQTALDPKASKEIQNFLNVYNTKTLKSSKKNTKNGTKRTTKRKPNKNT